MLFVKITNLVSINIPLIKYRNSMIFQDLFFSNKSFSFSGDTNTAFCYFIFVKYNHILITYAYIVVFIILNHYISLDYMKSINSIMDSEFVNAGLLIFSIYVLCDIKSISILILEVRVCNLNAFSLYYWFGFQLIRRRDNYYNTNYFHNVSNTAYILVNTKAASKNTFRRYFL